MREIFISHVNEKSQSINASHLDHYEKIKGECEGNVGEATHRPMISLWRPNKTCAWQLEYGAYLRADLRRILATVARYRPGLLSPAVTPRVNSSSSSSEDRRRSCPHPSRRRAIPRFLYRQNGSNRNLSLEICDLNRFRARTRDFLPLIARLSRNKRISRGERARRSC